MKPYLLLLLLLMLLSLMPAQEVDPFVSLRHSAPDINGNIHLRWEDIDDVAGATECYYRVGTAAWDLANTTVYSPGTKEALLPYTYGSKLRYRLRFTTTQEEGEFALMHQAYWDADTFPPNVNAMAFMLNDPAGDLLIGTNTNLDIRETYTASTENKLYISMKNVTGLYPVNNGLTSFNVYLATITTPDALADSLTYAMVYSANIPLLLSNGLYKVGFDINTQLPVFTRIGNISAQVSNGTLHMACNYSDLAADPSFGAWPNEYSALMLATATMSVTISTTPTIDTGDYSNPSGVIFRDNLYHVMQNTLPVADVFSYANNLLSLSYYDADGDFPLVAEVETNTGTVIQAIQAGITAHDCIYTAAIPMGTSGVLAWRFSDNGYSWVTGSYQPVSNIDASLLPLPISCIMPNPFVSGKMEPVISLKNLNSEPLKVSLYNLRGQCIGVLHNGKPAGNEIVLNWQTQLNANPASGVYLIMIEQGNSKLTRKFIITK